ncbi:DUF962 domain-containing protein [Arenibaculum pallidiluteum]|uniref:DUF962 domain-containing protein n=1 Tax=Arenibaculum pallidiluteum TaxID=2812559 RepID=UPI001A95F83B|nr:DUF962 domain-containing protein [Arenibaculum pallidiluteum]
MAGRFQTYAEFWPYYLAEHSRPATRLLHVLGTGLALVLLAAGMVTAEPLLVLLAVVSGYLFAWIGHFAVERNRPATFTHPWWSLVSDWRMFFLFLGGRLDAELRRHGIPAGRTAAAERPSSPGTGRHASPGAERRP